MQLGDRIAICKVVTVMVRNRDIDHRAGIIPRGIVTVRRRHAQWNCAANVFQACVAQQGTGQQTRFGQHLKAVADAHDIAATLRMGRHFATNRRVRRNRAAAQIIPVREPTGNADNIDPVGQAGIFMPDHRHFGTDRLKSHRQIAVTVRTRKNDDRCVHQPISTV